MLISFNDLRQFAVQAMDGRQGRAEDLYSDDESWVVRYVVTESGFLFAKQEGLVKATLIGAPDLKMRTLPISLTKEQLDAADSPDAHPPVNEQREREMRKRRVDFWPPVMLGVPGAVYTPATAERQVIAASAGEEPEPEADTGEIEDPHLRSLAEMSGYKISATDGDIGSISDFILDPEGWKIRYIVVDTGTWLPGRQVVIKPDWITDISWANQSFAVRVTKDEVSQAPELSKIDELERSDAYLAVAPYGAYGGILG